ncbi:MAG TPA: ABC transporter permease [Acidimicrobiales bacterium]|nr:ABC transporter permease [Acidimicrobiales bacterium]
MSLSASSSVETVREPGSPLSGATGEEVAAKIEGRGTWQLAWARLRRDRAAMIALGVIVVIILVAIFAPLFATVTGHGVNQQFRNTGLSPDGLPRGPNGTFVLGTDDQGRDVLVRIAYGTRISLFVGVAVTLIVVVIGGLLGLAAGYLGGIVDTLIARLIDIVLSLPYLMFAISLVSVGFLGGNQGKLLGVKGLPIIVFVIAVFAWAAIARIVRGQVLSIREKEYIEAARSLGASSWRIMIVDILPNVTTQLIVYATLLIPVTIVTEAALSFLGLGIPPPTADWGQMISESQVLYQQAWWFLFFPSAALVITTLAFNIFGDGIRDALDPRLERI